MLSGNFTVKYENTRPGTSSGSKSNYERVEEYYGRLESKIGYRWILWKQSKLWTLQARLDTTCATVSTLQGAKNNGKEALFEVGAVVQNYCILHCSPRNTRRISALLGNSVGKERPPFPAECSG